MDKELTELAHWCLKKVKIAGASDCSLLVRSERFVNISYRDRKPENIKEASTRELSLEVYAAGRYSVQKTSDLRRESLEKFIDEAVAMTKLLDPDPYRTLPDPEYFRKIPSLDLRLVDPDYGHLTPEKRHEVVKAIEAASLEAAGARVISVTAGEYDAAEEYLLLKSNGFEGQQKGTVFQMGASVTLQDAGDRRPSEGDYRVGVRLQNLPQPEEIGQRAAERTKLLLGAKKLKTEKLPVIIENRNVATLLRGFLAAMSGSNIQQKRSCLADKKGQRVGGSHFTLIDDPFIPEALGSRLFDGDGMAAQKRVMIESGVLKEFYVDWYYSRKLGWQPTTASPSNLVIPPGKRSIQEIMKDLGRGIFITGFIGGNFNPTTGDFSIGIFGQLFEKEGPVQAIAEMNIAGNHLQLWHQLIEVGNDPWVWSPLRTPSLVFEGIIVSGL
ncbi:MAG: TldD/PmbA family protein [Candidatus Aminicenantales bacterium]